MCSAFFVCLFSVPLDHLQFHSPLPALQHLVHQKPTVRERQPKSSFFLCLSLLLFIYVRFPFKCNGYQWNLYLEFNRFLEIGIYACYIRVVKPGSARKANIGASVWISSQHQGQSNITKKYVFILFRLISVIVSLPSSCLSFYC